MKQSVMQSTLDATCQIRNSEHIPNAFRTCSQCSFSSNKEIGIVFDMKGSRAIVFKESF